MQQKENPSVFYLLELFLKIEDKISLKGFNLYHHIHTSGGSSLFVKSFCPQRKIKLNTELQEVAVPFTLCREINICLVYIPPSFPVKQEHLNSLLQQLPAPYIEAGDLNGHSILWEIQTKQSKRRPYRRFQSQL